MQYKRVWIPYDRDTYIKFDISSKVLNANVFPIDGKKTKEADKIIAKMLNEGWKIVSTTPVTSSINMIPQGSADTRWTFTSGIEVFMIKE